MGGSELFWGPPSILRVGWALTKTWTLTPVGGGSPGGESDCGPGETVGDHHCRQYYFVFCEKEREGGVVSRRGEQLR